MIVAFNKPFGVLCQFTPGATAVAGRPTLADFIPLPGVYPAGRLDHDSEGLLILTDEGAVNRALTDPVVNHPRTYLVQVEREPGEAALKKLAAGIRLDGKPTRPARAVRAGEPDWLWPREPPVRFRKSIPTAWLELTLTEGRNRQVRRMTAAAGHPTLRLIRIRIGAFALGDLKSGAWKKLDSADRARVLSSSPPR